MDKLQKIVQSRPDLKSDRSNYLQLAVKEGNAVRGTGPHKVRIVNCENATNKDYRTQEEIKGVNLILEENGETKKYFVPTLGNDKKFHYLIEKFAGIPEGTELVMEYKRKPGSAKGFIDVQLAHEEMAEVQDGDIPVVNEEDYGVPEEVN